MSLKNYLFTYLEYLPTLFKIDFLFPNPIHGTFKGNLIDKVLKIKILSPSNLVNSVMDYQPGGLWLESQVFGMVFWIQAKFIRVLFFQFKYLMEHFIGATLNLHMGSKTNFKPTYVCT